MIATILKTLAPLGSKFIGKFFKNKLHAQKTVADWENEAIKASKGSWKDEFLTLVFASPICLQIIGAVQFAFGWGTEFLDAADMIYNSFARVGLDYTQVMLLIIGASFGVHVTRTVKQSKVAQAATEIAKSKASTGVQENR